MLDCLYKLQKKIVRAISFKDRYAHSTPLFHKLKILKIQDVNCLKLLSLAYECKINESVRLLIDFFVPLSPFIITTQGKLPKEMYFYHIYQLLIMERGHPSMQEHILWNDLQPMIKESCSTNVFKKKLHDYYLSFYD